eukprot:TRINITY_DN51381_c0_g1_i1.p1 TRINITY_DN51381_c0_g1~~TRINITY_DN51381_c0_g1_i1.p1  ORF type:complete len:265 (+),score=48.44 TRINITY_DN51381_c0_g1_i1:112-906(+)
MPRLLAVTSLSFVLLCATKKSSVEKSGRTASGKGSAREAAEQRLLDVGYDMEDLREAHSLTFTNLNATGNERSLLSMTVACSVCTIGVLRLEDLVAQGQNGTLQVADLHQVTKEACGGQAKNIEEDIHRKHGKHKAVSLMITKSLMEQFCAEATNIFCKALVKDYNARRNLTTFCEDGLICEPTIMPDIRQRLIPVVAESLRKQGLETTLDRGDTEPLERLEDVLGDKGQLVDEDGRPIDAKEFTKNIKRKYGIQLDEEEHPEL